jgi:DNA-binding response OmpR family regulator
MSSYALIADPDPAASFIYASAAREEGLIPVISRDGAAASSVLLERGMPGLLITELALFCVDGFELIERVRRCTTPSNRVPIVAVSADRVLRERAAERRAQLGIGAILTRVASDDSVKRVIKRLLGGDEDQTTMSPPRRGDGAAEPKPAPGAPPRPLPSSLVVPRRLLMGRLGG